ncbi:MAG: hypothetical protein ACLUER_14135 [Odoribacter splanchnicus]|jgi:hypothetical protein
MNAREEIINWMRTGCDIGTGVTLYSRYGDNARFKLLLSHHPQLYVAKLRLLLSKIAQVKSGDYSSVIKELGRDKFRQMYPFLTDRNCPMELKALAADKITTYWQCVGLHEQLFTCHKNEDCRNTAASLVHTFIEDCLIKRELEYYKQHHGILGKHPIFAEQRKINNIRKMSIRELLRKEKQLRDNIWRIESELKKGDKPHLQHKRKHRLEEKKRELELVISLQNE